jgi:hypothetical protein
MSTRITPTFLLKGVDPEKVKADYRAGFFSRPSKIKNTIKIANATAILAPTYGNTNRDGVFSVKDRNNSTVVIATTGHQGFVSYNKTGSVQKGGRCEFCRIDFQDVAIGYPISYQEMTVLTNSGTEEAKYRVLYNFWTEGCFCTFECALGYVRNILSRPADYRDTTVRDSERMLKLLYMLSYPQSGVLRPAQDPRLLIENGGSLTREEWGDNRHVYVRSDRVLMVPAKVEYVQTKLGTPSAVPGFAAV